MRPNPLLSVILAVMALGGAITTQILSANNRFVGKTWLLPYLYAAYGLLFIVALWLAVKPGHDQAKPRIVPLRYGGFDEGVRKINGRWHKADGTPFTVEEVLIGRHVGKHGLFVKNEGEAAYDISVSEPRIGTSKLKFETDKSRLAKEDGEESFAAWIE